MVHGFYMAYGQLEVTDYMDWFLDGWCIVNVDVCC